MYNSDIIISKKREVIMDSQETKVCKYCGSEIPKNAKVCPHCRKKQSHKVRNTILIILGILVLLVLLFSCMNTGGSSTSETTTTTEEQATQTDYTIGQTASIDGVDITLNSASVATSIPTTFGIDQTPEAGNVFLITDWSVTNNSDSTYYLSSSTFTTYVDNNALNSDAVTYSTTNPFQFSEVGAGRQTGGTIVYQVPEGWQLFEAEVEVNIFSSQTATFTITPNQVS